MSAQSKHQVEKFATYIIKAIKLLFNSESQSRVELVEPLETLAKMSKASHAIQEALDDE